MTEEIKSWFIDIDTAIGEIEIFLPAQRDFSEFRKDLKTPRQSRMCRATRRQSPSAATRKKEDTVWTEIARGVEKTIQALQKRKQRQAREREMPFGRRE